MTAIGNSLIPGVLRVRLREQYILDLAITGGRNMTIENQTDVDGYLEVINAYNHKSISGCEYAADYDDSKKTPIYQLHLLPYIGVEMEF
jgi:hypothetical protein